MTSDCGAHRLIGLAGFAGAGKDTVADILCREHGFRRAAFADRVRQMAAELDAYLEPAHATYGRLLAEHGYDRAKRDFPCVREYLIRIGHGARAVFGPGVWLDAVLPPGHQHADGRLVITDVRYANEAERVRAAGGQVWRVARRGYDGAHQTERDSLALVQHNQVVLNYGTIAQLELQIKGMIDPMWQLCK